MSKLSYKTVKFDHADCLTFAKKKFRLLKTSLKCLEDEEKAAKKKKSNNKAKRSMRKKHVSTWFCSMFMAKKNYCEVQGRSDQGSQDLPAAAQNRSWPVPRGVGLDVFRGEQSGD
jgi:hypothetical protein